MRNLLSDLIRWCSVVRGGADTAQLPVQQIEYLGKTADCVMLFPYGMHANVDGSALALMVSVGGASDNRAAIPSSMDNRPQLAPGEVVIYSPKTGSAVTFKANGDVLVSALGDLTATVTGNASVTVGGSASVTASGSITLTAPTIALNGAVAIVGGLVADSIGVTGTLTQGGKDVGGAHVHSGVTVGAGNTGGVV